MGVRARVIAQKKDLDEMVKVVVLFLVWEWRCDGGGRPKRRRLGLRCGEKMMR